MNNVNPEAKKAPDYISVQAWDGHRVHYINPKYAKLVIVRDGLFEKCPTDYQKQVLLLNPTKEHELFDPEINAIVNTETGLTILMISEEDPNAK